MNYGSSKSAKIVISKSILDVKNQSYFFLKILSNLGHHYLVKTFLSKLDFEPLYFLKLRPIFDKLTRRNFLQKLHWWHVDIWPKTLLFRTHYLKTPQPILPYCANDRLLQVRGNSKMD